MRRLLFFFLLFPVLASAQVVPSNGIPRSGGRLYGDLLSSSTGSPFMGKDYIDSLVSSPLPPLASNAYRNLIVSPNEQSVEWYGPDGQNRQRLRQAKISNWFVQGRSFNTAESPGNGWNYTQGAVVHPNGLVYTVAYWAHNGILVYDPFKKTINTILTSTVPAGYSQGTVDAFDKIWWPPFTTNPAGQNFLRYDPYSNTVTTYTFGLSLVNYAVDTIEAAPNGLLYTIPSYSNYVYVIDPLTPSLVASLPLPTSLTGGGKFQMSAITPEGDIYVPPAYVGTNTIMVIHTQTNTIEFKDYGFTFTGAVGVPKFFGVAFSRVSQKVYAIPNEVSLGLIIDPYTGTATETNFGGGFLSARGNAGLIEGYDGKLYSAPYDNPYWAVIDPATDVGASETLGMTYPNAPKRWYGSKLILGGKMYPIPYFGSTAIWEVTVASQTFLPYDILINPILQNQR